MRRSCWKCHTSTRFPLSRAILGFCVVFTSLIFLDKNLSYTLGACFDVKILEERYRGYVVANVAGFLESEDYFNMLRNCCPEKLLELVREALAARSNAEKELGKKHSAERTKLEESNELIVTRCKTVHATFLRYAKLHRLSTGSKN